MSNQYLRRVAGYFLTVPLVAGSACSRAESDAAAPAATVRDSAGITIVENPAVDEEALPFWTVDTVPAFTIGVLDGEPAYEFTSIKNVTQLPNGMIVVLDGRGETAFEFRFFDSTGTHVATHGRQGQGPGEFRWVNFVAGVGGDTVIAIDFSQRRISWLSASEGYLRSTMVDEPQFKMLLGEDVSNIAEGMIPLADSVFATRAFRRDPNASGSPFAGRFSQYDIVDLARDTTIHIRRHDEPGAVQVQLARRNSWMTNVIEAPIGVHVVDRARAQLCAASTGVAELTCADTAGTRRIVRWQPAIIPYTDADRRKLENQLRINAERNPSYYAPGDVEKLMAAYQFPTQYNPIRALQIDSDGNIWVLEQTRGARDSLIHHFRVLNAEGEQVAFATGFEVSPYTLNRALYFGSTSILRPIVTADGAEQIGVFPIRK